MANYDRKCFKDPNRLHCDDGDYGEKSIGDLEYGVISIATTTLLIGYYLEIKIILRIVLVVLFTPFHFLLLGHFLVLTRCTLSDDIIKMYQ